jgi:hypothetical protein
VIVQRAAITSEVKWITVVAAAVVLALGVFVAAIPPASIEARAQAAPIATDIVPGDDDSDNADADDDDSDDLAQQQEEDEQWQEQQEQDEEQLAQTDQQPGP